MNIQKGFTLIELMIVMAIIGLLSAVAYPAFTEHVTRGKVVEATSALSEIRIRLSQYYQDNKVYDNSNGGLFPSPCPASTKNFDFVCAPAAQSYLISAIGKDSMDGFMYTITEANLRASTTVWGDVGATCWITKKGETC